MATKSSKTKKTVGKTGTKRPASTVIVKAKAKPVVKPAVKTPVAPPKPSPDVSPVAAIESLRREVAALRTQLAKHMSPVATGTMEEVDAMRRVLSDLMEARTNDIIRDLVAIRNTAASAGASAQRVTEQMDTLLSDLGAMKFEAERLEHVDPLIHAVTREVSDPTLPDGVVAATLRPGFHTGHGVVVAKALVSVNRRS